MKLKMRFIFGTLVFVFGLSTFAGNDVNMTSEARIFKDTDGEAMPYRIMKPVHYDPKEKHPLVLCLHGAGGRGNDNRSRGTEAFKALSQDDILQKYPAFLLTPQCPKDKKWVNTSWTKGSYAISDVPISEQMKRVLQILQSVQNEFNIDPDRIYVTGQSMGGYGTWDIILRKPNLFAAAVPVCGAGDPGQAARIAHLPIWAFHGEQDPTVPVSGSRDMRAAIKIAGGEMKYTEYPGVGHKSWENAWAEKDLVPWLFKQKKSE
ncbi:MAG: prolyl oligopeptidase family serine peptidase [Lentisphaerae bacterium]|nr:prolyl oligopeptidase family serine peptidase [Lentisphaerota bacterium]